jgi:hypothetical protein
MKSNNTFGVHFVSRTCKSHNDKFPVYARISVNGTISEFSMKQSRHYRGLQIEDRSLTADAVKTAFLGIEKEKIIYSLLWLVGQPHTGKPFWSDQNMACSISGSGVLTSSASSSSGTTSS